jgi:hypothetical protein
VVGRQPRTVGEAVGRGTRAAAGEVEEEEEEVVVVVVVVGLWVLTAPREIHRISTRLPQRANSRTVVRL